MNRLVKRVLIIAAVIAGFILVWASMAFRWPAFQWIVPAGYGIFLLAMVYGLIRRPLRARQPEPAAPTASDEYSDLYLGRKPPTFPIRDASSSSQIGDPPSRSGALPPAP